MILPQRRRERRADANPLLPLFAAPQQPATGIPPHRGVSTSIGAAKSVAPYAQSQRQHVLDAITARGERGATLDELVVELDLPINARCWELRKARLVID